MTRMGRRGVDVFDRVDRYVITPQPDGLSTIVLYQEGPVFDRIRDVTAYDLQYRDEPIVITGATVIYQPDRSETFETERTGMRTTTTTKMMNVWAA